MQLIEKTKGKFRQAPYIGAKKVEEVIYVTTNPLRVCIVTIKDGRAQLYNVLNNEVTHSGAPDFESMQEWVQLALATHDVERHVFVCGTASAKYKMLNRIASGQFPYVEALVSAEQPDVYKIVEELPAKVEMNHKTHRFITDERQRCELIYVANQGYTWMVVESQLCGSKFHPTVSTAVEEAQADLLPVYMEKRNG